MQEKYNDFIIYADESGDHGPVSKEFPIFVLAFCVFKKVEYAEAVTTALTNLKFKWFGHDGVVLHERDIRKSLGPFAKIPQAHRDEFMADIGKVVDAVPFALIATVIRKTQHAERRDPGRWPIYQTAVKFNLERTAYFMTEQHASGRTHVVFESRGPKEDRELASEFSAMAPGIATSKGNGTITFDIVFAPKGANHCGHQLADLIARPIGQHILKPDQPNRAYELIEKKFRRSGSGKIDGYGLKVFA